jgi:putative SOS response-associated peptidase YedK
MAPMLNSELGKDPKIAYKTVNARVESVDTAPSYCQAFKKRRCLIPFDGFFEWKKDPDLIIVTHTVPCRVALGLTKSANR